MNGVEWIVEAYGCSAAALSDLRVVCGFFERLIGEMHLRPVGPAHWHQFPNTSGITGVCLLAESHIACHTFPEFQSLCLNLFCCVPRAEWDFEPVLRQVFGAESVSVRRIARPYRPLGPHPADVSSILDTALPSGRRQG